MKKSNYEVKVEQFENIISKLESGQVSLDESVLLYEEGIKLYNELSSILDNYQQKIEYITLSNQKEKGDQGE